MAYRDLKEVRDCYAGLRELVIHNSGGWDDAETRAKVERLCGAGIAALDDPECRERLRSVQAQAGELFSRLQILIVLEALNTRLFFIDTLRNRAA